MRERKTEGHCRYPRKDGIIPFVMSLRSYLRSKGAKDEVCCADRKVLGTTEASNNTRFVCLVFYFLVTSADKLSHLREEDRGIKMPRAESDMLFRCNFK